MNSKKPWYIWFSIFALIFLWGDTSRKIKSSRENLGLWKHAVGNMAKVSIVWTVLPLIIVGILADRLILRNFPEQPIVFELVNIMILLALYLGGVYATYKHSVWRKENISDLIAGKQQQAEKEDVGKCDE